MSLRTKIEVVFLILAIAAFRVWLSEHDARMAAAKTVAAQQKTVDQAAAQIRTLEETEKQRDGDTAAAVAEILANAAKQVTPAQIAAYVSKAIALPIPLSSFSASNEEAKTAGISESSQQAAESSQNAPEAPPGAIPAADLPALRTYVESCQANSVELSACKQDAITSATQLKLAGEQLSAMTKERDTWKKTAKGGSVFTRMARAGKWFGIGAGVGLVAICGSGHCR